MKIYQELRTYFSQKKIEFAIAVIEIALSCVTQLWIKFANTDIYITEMIAYWKYFFRELGEAEEDEDGCAECGSCATRLCDCDNILQAGAMIMQNIDLKLGLYIDCAFQYVNLNEVKNC